MTVLIPLKKAYGDNIELRYALRSMDRCFEIDRLIIVGYCPAWLQGAEVIPFNDSPNGNQKENNIYGKILTGFGLSNSFLFANDDHYITESFNIDLAYSHADLITKKEICRTSLYKKTIENTINLIGNYPYFDVHCPLMFYADLFPFNLESRGCGYCIKTVYAKAAKLSGVEHEDFKVKIKSADYSYLNSKLFFSSSEACFHDHFFDYLQSRWPEPTKFENL